MSSAPLCDDDESALPTSDVQIDSIEEAAQAIVSAVGKDHMSYLIHPLVNSGIFTIEGDAPTAGDIEVNANQLLPILRLTPAAVPSKYLCAGICYKTNEIAEGYIYKFDASSAQFAGVPKDRVSTIAAMTMALDDGTRCKKLIQKVRELCRKSRDSRSPGLDSLKKIIVFPCRALEGPPTEIDCPAAIRDAFENASQQLVPLAVEDAISAGPEALPLEDGNCTETASITTTAGTEAAVQPPGVGYVALAFLTILITS